MEAQNDVIWLWGPLGRVKHKPSFSRSWIRIAHSAEGTLGTEHGARTEPHPV